MTGRDALVATPRVALDRPGGRYQPGERLSAAVTLDPGVSAEVRSIELSVVWFTAGKGDEDLHVHEFRRWRGPLGEADLRIATILPKSPLSYAGVSVKVCWAVRVRLETAADARGLIETPFQLGKAARPRLPNRPADASPQTGVGQECT